MTHTLDAVAAAAWQDLVDATQRTFPDAAGRVLRRQDIGSALQVIARGNDSLLFNRVIGLGAEVPHQTLESMLEGYRRAEVQRFFIHLYEEDLSPELGFWLAEHGIRRYRRDWHKLVRGTHEPLPEARSELSVVAATPRHADAITRIFAQGFDLTPQLGSTFAAPIGRAAWHVHVACRADQVVAASLLFVHDSVGYIAGAATDPAFRGLGAQSLLLRERVRIALDLGCKQLVSETGAPHSDDPQHSYRNLQRAGFRPIAVRRNYAPEGTLWRHGARE